MFQAFSYGPRSPGCSQSTFVRVPEKDRDAKDRLRDEAIKPLVKLVVCLGIVAAICGSAPAKDTFQQDFLVPPVKAKPAVWWFWGETVTTDQGIRQDLEALKRVGFGGVVIYEQTL